MEKTIITAVAMIALSAPLAWGTCTDQNCHDASPADAEIVPGDTVPVAPGQTSPQNKGTPRSGIISDFVTPGRQVEKDCVTGVNCHDAGKPLENSRAPEKACETPECR